MRKAHDRPRRIWRNTLMTLILATASASPALAQRFDGFNLVSTPEQAFGSAAARRSLDKAKQLGATTVAIIPFLWQAKPSSPQIGAGNDVPDEALRAAIRQAHKQGFTVVVKPQVWVPESWAGAVQPDSEEAWKTWFAGYRGELERIAKISAEEGAEALAIGTELAKTTHRPEWAELIATARANFPRTLFYVAHNVEEAEAVTFWPQLDAIGVSLYPPLGADDDETGRVAVMTGIADELDAMSTRLGKPVIVGEIGLRSAKGATAKPWESAEERDAPADPKLQADVMRDWLAALNRPSIKGVMVWRWFTNPDAGGVADTDFTVQGKPAEAVFACAWAKKCTP
jgi:hypothetical protein